MEEEMKNTGAFNESAEEMQQQETFNENTLISSSSGSSKKRAGENFSPARNVPKTGTDMGTCRIIPESG